MTDDIPPKKKRRFLSRFIPQTVAGKAAVATAIVLWLTLIVVWAVRRFAPQSIPAAHALRWYWMLTEFLLVLIIPFVLYWGLRRWNQVIEGMYPDIDHAWQKGVEALEANGISILERPLFLILGSHGSELEHGLMNALEAKFKVKGIPDETGISPALQWYASADAIYLFCPGCCSLSTLMGRWTTPSSTDGGRPRLAMRTPKSSEAMQPKDKKVDQSPRKQDAVPSPHVPSANLTGPQQAASYLGTIQVPALEAGQVALPTRPDRAALTESLPVPGLESSSVSEPVEPAGSLSSIDGTILAEQMPSSPTTEVASARAGQALDGVAAPARLDADRLQPSASSSAEKGEQETPSALSGGAKKIALPASLDTSDQLPRLRYVCKLLRRIRRPRCGVNGIVTLVPFGLSRVGSMQLSALAQSAHGDVTTIQDTLRIRAPVTAMLVGLEQDKGFTELVRRLQPDLLSRRLGGRFDLRSRPTPQELNAHSDRLCDAFEDWVYRLFSRDDALAQHRGNRKLYGLISRIRYELKPRLRIVLGKAFGCESNNDLSHVRGDSSFFFSGCYFAASADSTDRPAFVKGVLQDKLVEEQSQVEWTPAAWRIHAYFRLFALAGWLAAGILAAMLLAKLLPNVLG